MGKKNLLEIYRVLKEVLNKQAWEARDQGSSGRLGGRAPWAGWLWMTPSQPPSVVSSDSTQGQIPHKRV